MKKVVVKVEFNDDKIKKKAMQSVSGLLGVESVSVDMKDQKMTLIGDIDPVQVVCKLRKLCHAEILSVGPAKEEKAKDKPKYTKKKGEGKKKVELDAVKTEDKKKEELDALVKAYEAYFSQTRQPYPYYYRRTVEEDPNGCVIC